MIDKRKLIGIVLSVSAAFVGALLSLVFTHFIGFEESKLNLVPEKQSHGSSSPTYFNPPKPEEAPDHIRDAVLLGYNIMRDTQKYAAQYVGNSLNCTNCHFDAGRERKTISLVGVAAIYPKYRERQHYSVDLVARTVD